MKVVSCALVFCFILSAAFAGNRKGRLQQIADTLDNLVAQIDGMQQDKEQCDAKVSDMDHGVRELTDKIDNLDSACLTADIDIARHEGKHCTSKVRLDLPSEFHSCLENIDSEHISELNAQIYCLRLVLWRFQDSMDENDEAFELLQEESESESARVKRSTRFIRRRIAPRNITQPRTGFRIRKEYRTLSYDERQRYHNALNVLYEDGTLECFALVHKAALQKKGAHGGPAFLPWHRVFLSLYEEAIRQVDPTVSLPYWDSSIDDNIEAGPGLSVVWDEHHFGTGTGPLNEGPFSEWMTPTKPLARDIARGVGSLIRQSKIDSLSTYCRLKEFTPRLESAHNSVHRWVGGAMARSLAACDPVFYMHHAFIDYQWEVLRKRQLPDCGINPIYDYPPTDDANHHADSNMDGMAFLQNKDGIADFWTTNWYSYEDRPSCANNCGNSPDMFCDNVRNVCVGEIRFNFTQIGNRKKRQVSDTQQATNDTIDKESSLDTCMTDIYKEGCSKVPRPGSLEEIVKSAVLDETTLKPGSLTAMDEDLRSETDYAGTYPPESEPVVFNGAPDEPNDSRTMETTVYDMLKMVLERKTTESRKYADQLNLYLYSK